MQKVEKKLYRIFYNVGIILVLYVVPKLMVFSINTLFEKNVPFNFKSWAAALVFYFIINYRLTINAINIKGE